jgi:Ser/Thr protein kinase RdoA (MazF antagonist)
VRLTTRRQLVGSVDGWALLAISYIEGTVLGTEPAALGLLAQTVGRLHALPHAAPSASNDSRCHPDSVAHAARQLALYGSRVPPEFRPLAADLHASMLALQQYTPPELHTTHGDCWYMNAVRGPDGRVVLIDWDNAGIGLPLLDLGTLLLSSHFDPSQPLVLEPSAAKIEAIMRGYRQARPIDRRDLESLADAMRFLLAFQLGSYAADERRVAHPEFPFVLRKLRARTNAALPIAEIAARYSE